MAGAKRVCQILVLVLVVTYAAAMSTGAPSGACSTFTPGHPAGPQSGDGGFKIYSTLIDNGGIYVGGQSYMGEKKVQVYIMVAAVLAPHSDWNHSKINMVPAQYTI